MRCMLGLDRPDTGGASFDNRSYRQLSSPLHEVGALLDAGYVHPGRSGRNHLRWLAASNGLSPSRGSTRCSLSSVSIRLAGAGSRRTRSACASGSGLAGVLLGDPHTVVLDEPANGLDPEGIRWIRDVLVHLAVAGPHRAGQQPSAVGDGADGQRSGRDRPGSADRAVHGRAVRRTPCRSVGAGHAAPASMRLLVRPSPRALRPAGSTRRPPSCAASPPIEVGELAARDGIVLHELSPQTGSLEDAFLQGHGGSSAVRRTAGGGPAMIDTIRSEWIKLRTVRMNLVLFIIAVAFPVIVCVLVASLGDITDLQVADVAGLVAGSSVITALAARRCRCGVDQRRVRLRHDSPDVRGDAAARAGARRQSGRHRLVRVSSPRRSW